MNKDTNSPMSGTCSADKTSLFEIWGLWTLSTRTKSKSIVRLHKEPDTDTSSFTAVHLWHTRPQRTYWYSFSNLLQSFFGPPKMQVHHLHLVKELEILGFAERIFFPRCSFMSSYYCILLTLLHFTLPWTYITGPVWHLTTTGFCVSLPILPSFQDALLPELLSWSKRI